MNITLNIARAHLACIGTFKLRSRDLMEQNLVPLIVLQIKLFIEIIDITLLHVQSISDRNTTLAPTLRDIRILDHISREEIDSFSLSFVQDDPREQPDKPSSSYHLLYVLLLVKLPSS